ncbi:MAG: hypothetical protein IIA02_00110 [Proteobacteria bacterium]|nr:hypothetical protein [Pseudomonadota bacterium]
MSEELNEFDRAYNELFRGRALNTQHLNDCKKIWRAALTQRPAAQDEREAPYGYCPECGAPGVTRERRPDGDDKCSNGHRYPSRSAHASLPTQPAAQEYAALICNMSEQEVLAAIRGGNQSVLRSVLMLMGVAT